MLESKNLHVAYGDVEVVKDVSFSLMKGEIACLLGSSGCGKTTILRTIAGFEKPRVGKIRVNGITVADPYLQVAPERRNVGMVFQDFALFPHLSVEDNVGFGLRNMSASERQKRIDSLIELTGLEHICKRFPHQLSGGQQQRVALVRAMAPRPDVLLLDEPFSSMDVELREQLASEVRDILKYDDITAILVSHNQMEAFAVADKIGVLREGRMEQWDTSYRLYHNPQSHYVASFIGEGVFIKGRICGEAQVETALGVISGRLSQSLPTGTYVDVLIRPDDIIHDDHSEKTARVIKKAFRGPQFLYTLGLDAGEILLSLVPSHHNHALNSAIGFKLEIDHLVVFESDT